MLMLIMIFLFFFGCFLCLNDQIQLLNIVDETILLHLASLHFVKILASSDGIIYKYYDK